MPEVHREFDKYLEVNLFLTLLLKWIPIAWQFLDPLGVFFSIGLQALKDYFTKLLNKLIPQKPVFSATI